MDHLELPNSNRNRIRYLHSSQPQIQTSMDDFPSTLAAVVASSSAATIAVPYLSINRMAYSWSSFNQQFRRHSQVPDLPSVDKVSDKANNTSGDSSQSRFIKSRIIPWFNVWGKSLSDQCLSCSEFFVNICTSLTPLALSKRYLPALEWMLEYQKVDLIPDLLAGLTITVFHVPESKLYILCVFEIKLICLYF